MSASSARRLRDRNSCGGGTAKVSSAVKPSRSVTPVSGSSKIPGSNAYFKSPTTGKENPRPISKGPAMAQKSAMRPVPRVDKAAMLDAGEVETRYRRSTSSVPRGRSSSPSEIVRGLKDVRRDRRASADRSEKVVVSEVDRGALSSGKGFSGRKESRGLGVRITEGEHGGLRVFRDSKEKEKTGVHFDKKSGTCGEIKSRGGECERNFTGIRAEKCDGIVDSDLIKSREGHVTGDSESSRPEDCLQKREEGSSLSKELKMESCSASKSVTSAPLVGKGSDSISKEAAEKPLKQAKFSDTAKGLHEEGGCSKSGNKYPSKLHEKLAFLEGKVKRIASDIKKTKEMLDMNNPDASKVLLSDIQDKISGIEKAMGRAGSNSDVKVRLPQGIGNDNQETKISGKDQSNEVENRRSVKGLNTEELEERLLPHHKLLRSRPTLRNEAHDAGPSSETTVEDASLITIEENPIALEFLASLNNEQMKVSTRTKSSDLEFSEVQDMDGVAPSGTQGSVDKLKGKQEVEFILTSDEVLADFDDQENMQRTMIMEDTEDTCIYQLNEIGSKTSTGGWFVSEGEATLLAHSDGTCSFYDVTNTEEKAVYKPPAGFSHNMWRDCWIIRAPGADGCSGRYVVAASAGNTTDSGFCSWDFYTKDVRACQIESGGNTSRAVLAPLTNDVVYRRSASFGGLVSETHQWWYKPCGPLMISTASSQKVVKVFDIRDGEEIMTWEVQKPVSTMDYASPLQWRNRGKVVIAEAETISLWDVNSLTPQALLSVSYSGQRIHALHVNNTDAELGGGVRQRVSSSEVEGHDGVFCSTDSINILDFRLPSGVGLKIPKVGVNAQSVFSRGDSIFLGCSGARSIGKKQTSSKLQQFSLRKQRLLNSYALPESNGHSQHAAITQVWGNSDLVMGVSGQGLFIFDALSDDGSQSFAAEHGNINSVREIIGPYDLYSPSFDYLASRILLISRDRPAVWRLLQ